MIKKTLQHDFLKSRKWDYIVTVKKNDTGSRITFNYARRRGNVKSLIRAAEWFNKYLYKLTINHRFLKNHFKSIHNKIPSNVPFFYEVVTDIDINGNFMKTYTKAIGVGKDEIDALSTNSLRPQISYRNDYSYTQDGYFVKAYKKDKSMIFETIEGDYKMKLRAARLLTKEKLKKITLSLPIDEKYSSLTLTYTNYWTSIANNYLHSITNENLKTKLISLNKNFKVAETNFRKSVNLYLDYKKRISNISNQAQLVSLILKGASYANDLYSKDATQAELNQIRENEKTFSDIIDSINKQLKKQKDTIKSLHKELKEFHQINNIPLNDIINIDFIILDESIVNDNLG